MRHKIIFASLMFCLSGCFSSHEEYLCPDVKIPRSSAYLTTEGRSGEIYMELYGYDAYCLKRGYQTRAVITPLFRVERREKNRVETVDAIYYVQKGRSKKTFSESLTLKTDEKQAEFKGKPIEVRLDTPGKSNSEIILGLSLSKEQDLYNQQTFDIGFEKELRPVSPVIVKKSVGCSSCSL